LPRGVVSGASVDRYRQAISIRGVLVFARFAAAVVSLASVLADSALLVAEKEGAVAAAAAAFLALVAFSFSSCSLKQ